MVDSTKKTTRSEGGTPTRPGKKTNTNTSADYGSKPITEYFPSIPKLPDSQDPPPLTQDLVDGWDDLSATSQPSQPDLTNNPFSPLATNQRRTTKNQMRKIPTRIPQTLPRTPRPHRQALPHQTRILPLHGQESLLAIPL